MVPVPDNYVLSVVLLDTTIPALRHVLFPLSNTSTRLTVSAISRQTWLSFALAIIRIRSCHLSFHGGATIPSAFHHRVHPRVRLRAWKKTNMHPYQPFRLRRLSPVHPSFLLQPRSSSCTPSSGSLLPSWWFAVDRYSVGGSPRWRAESKSEVQEPVECRLCKWPCVGGLSRPFRLITVDPTCIPLEHDRSVWLWRSVSTARRTVHPKRAAVNPRETWPLGPFRIAASFTYLSDNMFGQSISVHRRERKLRALRARSCRFHLLVFVRLRFAVRENVALSRGKTSRY